VVDSMQVYRGMDMGTGKPPFSIRQEIPHHGLDLVDPEEEFHVARYVQEMAPVVEAISRRGHWPILVGGSGLYFKALLDGICPAPGKDPRLRQQLWSQGEQEGSESLYARLQGIDPPAASRIHPNDLRRIVRALEVYLLTGRPLTAWQEETSPSFADGHQIRFIGLTCDRAQLYQQIGSRIDGWLAAGWLEEARGLFTRPLSLTAREALGYRELFAFLEGRVDWPETMRLIKRNTRRYAKRQWAWFRVEPRVRWIPVDARPPEEIANEILRRIFYPPVLDPHLLHSPLGT